MNDPESEPVGFFRKQQAQGKGFRKLTAERVQSIRERYAEGCSQRSIAISERIAPSTVHAVVSGQTWRTN